VKPIKYHKSFQRSFKKRVVGQSKLLQQFESRLKLFAAGKHGRPLDDHALTGTLAGKRAFSITGDVRVIYVELKDAIVLLDIGTHNQIY
jgi:addiction module RelE/StbE family toxin